MLATEFKTNLQSHKRDINTSRKQLSKAQRGVWIAQKMDLASPRYNCGGYLEINGAIELEFFKQAVNIAVVETEALHLHFFEDNGEIWQAINSSLEWSLHFIDASEAIHPQQSAVEWMKTDLLKVVGIFHSEPLFNHALFKVSSNKFFLYFRYHHILMDGFSQVLYWQRMSEIYSALIEKDERYSESSFGSISDVLEEESTYFTSLQCERDRKFWQEALTDLPNPIRLTNSSSNISRNLLRRVIELSESDIENLKKSTHIANTRWSVILIAVTAAFIHRLTGIEDLIFGLPVSGRLTPTSRTTPCMMANELPLRLQIHSTDTCRKIIEQVSLQIGLVLKHQRYRSEDLYQELKLFGNKRQLVGPVLNVVSFDRDIRFAGFTTNAHYLSSGPVRDLLIGFYGKSDSSKMQIYFDANPEIYSANDVATIQKRFHIFLKDFLTVDLDNNINKINIFLDGEFRKIAYGFNNTSRPYDLSKCLHILIDKQAQLTPDANAVITQEKSVTYRQLIEYSNKLALYIREKGVLPGQRVGVYETRSIDMVVSLLAILKVGAAYVPLDPEQPESRIQHQIRDADVNLILSKSIFTKSLVNFKVEIILVDEIISTLPNADASEQLAQLATPKSAAYVIYTSGSTGVPKGVVLSHEGIVNRLKWMQETYDLNSQDCVLQKTPFTFDVSVWEIFWPLLVGSRLFLAAPQMHRDPRYIVRTIQEQNITTVHFVPPMLDLFLAELESVEVTKLRIVICSGEALKPRTVEKFFEVFEPNRHNVELYNLYGPTEASIDVTSWQCTPTNAKSTIPIGRPVANTHIYILDPSGEPTPIGTPGEIYIGGVQVALGYLNLPKVNKEKFVPSPFFKNETLYRTGDLAFYRQDGVIEFLGRLDNQVKIRGFRIELGEIESALKTHPMVSQTVASIWERQIDDRRLVAYVVLNHSNPFEIKELEIFLATKLPEYMIPSHIILLDRVPLLSNGKINRRSLPKPVESTTDDNRVKMPTTSEEQLLYEAWCHILGLKCLSVDDSFFALGGDSMLSIRLRTFVERHGYTFNIQELFRFPTISKLAKQLRIIALPEGSYMQNTEPFGMIAENDRMRLPKNIVDAYPISVMQAGMLFHTELDSESSVYRVVTSLHITTNFELDVLHEAIRETFQRHPLLRSSFDLSSYSEPLQLVHNGVEVLLEVVRDISRLDISSQEHTIQEWIEKAKFQQFDISTPPLVLFKVHLRSDNDFQLSAVEHHAVIDGWSDVLMIDEIVTRYHSLLNEEEMWLSEIPSVYRSFVAAEKQALASEASQQFWKNHLHAVESVQLPYKSLHFEDNTQSFNHQSFEVPIKKEVAEQLRLTAQQENLPLKSILVAAHIAVMRQICSKQEIVTGIVFNGRLEEEGGDEVIGVFLNTLPLRINVQNETFISIAHKVFEQEQNFLPHGRYPFAQMQQDTNGQIYLDSYVNFMDFHRKWKEDKLGNNLINKAIGVAETNFPLAVNFLVDPVESYLRLWLDCNTSLLDPDFCKRLVSYYKQSLNIFYISPDISIDCIDLKDQSEINQITSWNNTFIPYNHDATVHSLIEDQAKRSINNVALAYCEKTINYEELDLKANQLAHYLQMLGVKKGQLIGVCLKRGFELIVALVAVLKAGGAYVPLDPSFPEERLKFIVTDSGLDYLVSDTNCPIETQVQNTILVDTDRNQIECQLKSPVESEACSDDLAYVIYTSGSTGVPKGTAVTHRNVVNFFVGMNSTVGCNSEDVVLAITSVSFDISVLELIWPLTCGAEVVIAEEQIIKNLVPVEDVEHSFSTLCQRHKITLVQGTPSFFSAITLESLALDSLSIVRTVLVGGEVFPAGLANRLMLKLPHTRIFNMYGPTETTIWSTVHELNSSNDVRSAIIPIGRPIANTKVQVLDEMHRLVPIGVSGELWIGGEGLTNGYLGRPELTAERFCEPLAESGLMYKTGDRVRWRSDGVLEFLGRFDRQIKILGQRIELDEVESVISRHSQVASVAVVATSKGSKNTDLKDTLVAPARLVAYIVTEDKLFKSETQKDHLQQWSNVWQSAYTTSSDIIIAEGNNDIKFAGWLSSYTGEPIPIEQMQEWLTHTINKINELQSQSIVDVGVGVGLILEALAPKVRRYIGIDVSQKALERAAYSLGGKLPSHVSLIKGDASHVAKLKSNETNTVVLNSVVQYFPGIDYLKQVLQESIRVIDSEGKLFIGDVRNLDLLKAFHATVQLYRSPSFMSARQLAEIIDRQVSAERELCLSPTFFRQFSDQLNQNNYVRIEIKRGNFINELTCFRYDVILTLCSENLQPDYKTLSWSEFLKHPKPFERISDILKNLTENTVFTIAKIPNQRLIRPLSLVNLIDTYRTSDDITAWDLERYLWQIDDTKAVNPEDLVKIGENLGFSVSLAIPEDETPGEFNAIFKSINLKN